MFKKGDLVENISKQWLGREIIDNTRLYVVFDCRDGLALEGMIVPGTDAPLGIFSYTAFKLVDPKTLSALERAIYGLPE